MAKQARLTMKEDPFKILDNSSEPTQHGEHMPPPPEGEIAQRIKSLIGGADIVLFIKGTPQFPQCGFSANAIGILNQLGKSFKTFDILSDPAIRQGLKEYSNWPTYPQLYVRGELIGGNDILMEMHQQGELEKVLNC